MSRKADTFTLADVRSAVELLRAREVAPVACEACDTRGYILWADGALRQGLVRCSVCGHVQTVGLDEPDPVTVDSPPESAGHRSP